MSEIPTPPGQSAEEPKLQEILLPKEKIRPLARGIIQLFEKPLKEIHAHTPSSALENDEFLKDGIESIPNSLREIETLLDVLLRAKKVRLILKPEGGEFVPLGGFENESPQEGTITLEDDEFKRILLAQLSHNIGTPLTGVFGWAELIKDRGNSSEVKDGIVNVYTASSVMLEHLDSIRNATKLKITTDKEGKTTIQAIRNNQ